MQKRPFILLAVTSPVSTDFFTGQLDYLIESGFDLALVCSPGWKKHEQVQYFPVAMEREISPVKDLISLWVLIRLLRKIKPDVVNAGTPKAGLLVSLAAFCCRIPVRLYTCHGLRLETLTGWKRRVLSMTERIAAFCSHRVICVSPSLREKVLELRLTVPEKAMVIGDGSCNGVDLVRFRRISERLEQSPVLINNNSIVEKAVYIGFVGRLTRDKGIYELMEVFSLLKTKFPYLYLLLVGGYEDGDPVSAELQTLIENDDRVIETGEVLDPVPYYRLMKALVLPSYREGLPTVLLEAGAMGIPVVATRVTGCVDVVVHQETGLLVSLGDTRAMTDSIGMLLKDDALASQYGEQAHLHIARRFRQELVWQNIAQIYRTLCDNALGGETHSKNV